MLLIVDNNDDNSSALCSGQFDHQNTFYADTVRSIAIGNGPRIIIQDINVLNADNHANANTFKSGMEMNTHKFK